MKALYSIVGTAAMSALLVGCATPMGPNQAGGTVIGAASGAVIGGAVGRSAGGALVGGAIGALAGALIGKDIDENTRADVIQGRPLTLDDIKALSRANVGDDLIVSQINSTRTVYRLDSAQIIDLKNSGVSQKVIDYMINTPMTISQSQPAIVSAPRVDYYYVAPAPYPYYYYYPYPYRYGPAWHMHHGYRR